MKYLADFNQIDKVLEPPRFQKRQEIFRTIGGNSVSILPFFKITKIDDNFIQSQWNFFWKLYFLSNTIKGWISATSIVLASVAVAFNTIGNINQQRSINSIKGSINTLASSLSAIESSSSSSSKMAKFIN